MNKYYYYFLCLSLFSSACPNNQQFYKYDHLVIVPMRRHLIMHETNNDLHRGNLNPYGPDTSFIIPNSIFLTALFNTLIKCMYHKKASRRIIFDFIIDHLSLSTYYSSIYNLLVQIDPPTTEYNPTRQCYRNVVTLISTYTSLWMENKLLLSNERSVVGQILASCYDRKDNPIVASSRLYNVHLRSIEGICIEMLNAAQITKRAPNLTLSPFIKAAAVGFLREEMLRGARKLAHCSSVSKPEWIKNKPALDVALTSSARFAATAIAKQIVDNIAEAVC